MSAEETLSSLDSVERGLSREEAERRLGVYGRNELEKYEGPSTLSIILAQINNPLVYVLLAATAISFAVHHAIDACVILGVVVLNTIIGFVQEHRAERAMEALRELAAPNATVRRGGEQMVVPAVSLVPGDIIILATGDKAPADARIISLSNLKMEEAALTGESVPVDKKKEALAEDTSLAERENMVYASTIVTYGRGEAVVTATGSSTEVGKIAQEVANVEREPTPLQHKLAELGRTMAILALALAAVVFLVGIYRKIEFVEIFLFSIASAVASIPEGLPAVVTIVLAIGLQRMAAKNAIVRKLPAVETLGSATVICSDKTGTLTKNEMTVKAIWTCGGQFEVVGEGYELHGEITLNGTPIEISDYDQLRLLLEAGALCNDAELMHEGAEHKIIGDPTEAALVVAAEKAAISKEGLKSRLPRIEEIPFDSRYLYMATLHRGENENFVFVKGAPERIIELCTETMLCDGVKGFDDELKKQTIEANHALAANGLRVLGIAYKKEPADKSSIAHTDLESGLVFLGLAGMIDPPRPEAIEAIKEAKRAGIRVIMATGDNIVTGRAIASQMGILREDGEAVDGKEFSAMSDEELAARVDKIDVFARVEPEHKLRLIDALRKRGHIVGMTGDGVNDAPALKKADIGISMGITGTDVAKEASEMVLADDNFASIVKAIAEGRVIFNNIKKVVTYLLSTNAGEQVIIIGTVLLGMPFPLTTAQILWINLVTDSLPALALAADPSREDILAEPPRDPKASILSKGVLIRIIMVAVIMAIGTITLFHWENPDTNLDKARTMAFASMGIFQLINSFNMRSAKKSIFALGVFSNKYLIGAVAVCAALQVAAINTPFAQQIFKTVPLSLAEWGIVVAVSSSVLWIVEIRKLLMPNLVD